MTPPLADRLRPSKIEDIVGQKHLLGEGKALRNIIDSGDAPNMIFYGPPGVGKTTLANIIAAKTQKRLHKLNGTNASTADIKQVVSELDTLAAPNGILLYLDEIQHFNKRQQQSLLEYMESGKITLIASTTENPYFYIYGAVLSRSTVFEFKSITPEETEPAVMRGFDLLCSERGGKYDISPEAVSHIAQTCGGDVRKALNAAELCVLAAKENGGVKTIDKALAAELTQRSSLRYDKDGNEHYDLLSAFQKSMRGSDPDAAVHYLARILEAGDLPSVCRRLLVCACEDVGLAWPMIIPIVKAAVDTALQVGMPEARIPLADAVILVCNSPKSNSAYNAVNAAFEDLKNGKTGDIPRRLQNKHFDGEDAQIKGQYYLYPHDFKNHYCKQQYLPDSLKNRKYYEYGDNKNEQAAKEYWSKIKKQDGF